MKNNNINKEFEYYVLYCTEDGTFSTNNFRFWNKDITKAFKFNNIENAISERSQYDDTVKILKIKCNIIGKII